MFTIAFGIVLGFILIAFLPFVIGMAWGLMDGACWLLFVLPFKLIKSIVQSLKAP